MDKIIKFSKNDNNITIAMYNSDDVEIKKIQINNEKYSLNGKEIYEFIDYSVGDVYTYGKIEADGKDILVLNKLLELFKSITDQVSAIKILENDQEMKDELNQILEEKV